MNISGSISAENGSVVKTIPEMHRATDLEVFFEIQVKTLEKLFSGTPCILKTRPQLKVLSLERL